MKTKLSEEDVMSMPKAGKRVGRCKRRRHQDDKFHLRRSDKLAYEIMTPRTDVFLIDMKTHLKNIGGADVKLRYSRILVCRG